MKDMNKQFKFFFLALLTMIVIVMIIINAQIVLLREYMDLNTNKPKIWISMGKLMENGQSFL